MMSHGTNRIADGRDDAVRKAHHNLRLPHLTCCLIGSFVQGLRAGTENPGLFASSGKSIEPDPIEKLEQFFVE